MRPRKTILLAGEDEAKLQITRYLLDLNYFAVQIAPRAHEALTMLLKQHYDVLIVDMPLQGAAILLDAAKAIDPSINILVLAERGTGLAEVTTADVAIWPEDCTSKAILDQARNLAARRRGPRAIRKPVARATLFDETMKKLS